MGLGKLLHDHVQRVQSIVLPVLSEPLAMVNSEPTDEDLVAAIGATADSEKVIVDNVEPLRAIDLVGKNNPRGQVMPIEDAVRLFTGLLQREGIVPVAYSLHRRLRWGREGYRAVAHPKKTTEYPTFLDVRPY